MSHYTALGSSISAHSLPREPGLFHEFARDGFTKPIRIFSQAECDSIHAHVREQFHAAPLDWMKGRAATDRFVYNLAARPQLLEPLTKLLGPNLILWGASVVRRKPGSSHPWHTDIRVPPPSMVGLHQSGWGSKILTRPPRFS